MAAVVRAVARSRADPRSDPRFRRVVDKLGTDSKRLKQHPPPAKKAAEARAAAKGPANEKAAGAKANQVDKIEQAETPKPQTASFLSMLQAEIAKVMPKTLGDTEKFMKDGSGGTIKGSLKGNVAQQKSESSADLKTASSQTPSETGVPVKSVTPIPGEAAPPAPQVDGAGAMPAPKPDTEVSLQASKTDLQGKLDQEKLTDDRMRVANDGRFSAVLTSKEAVNKQADTAPGKYRAKEGGTLAQAAAKAIDGARRGVVLLLNVKGASKTKVLSRQEQAKIDEEKERQRFTNAVEGVFQRTKDAVDKRLADLDGKVDAIFDPGVDSAISAMKTYVEDQLFDYKVKRYLLMPGGSLLWIKDQILELPEEVNRFYEAGRRGFEKAMNTLAEKVATLVESELAAAKAEVRKGQRDVAAEVTKLSPNLRSWGQAAQQDMAGRFTELETGIEDKKSQLAESLAQKYKEAFDKADAALKQIQDENKGLVAQAQEKIGEVLKALAEFKDRLMGILRKGADTIELILKDPMQFLSNLLAAIKAGFQQFVGNIWTHLKAGFAKWLFGALAGAGIEIPSDLTVVSVLKLVLGVLGLTYERMRAKAVKLLGETAVTVIEKLVSYLQTLIGGGPAALWAQIKGDISTLKEMVIDAIQNWIVTTIVKKAVAKIVSMFNPAGAIVQAVLMIISVVQFVIERASQIMDFVEAVINSISAIAQGAIGGAANWIEKSLANMVPLLIGFLAALVGLGGLSEKIRGFITKVQSKVDGAIDKVLKKAVAWIKKLFGKLTGKSDSPEEKKKRLEDGANAAVAAAAKYSGKFVGAIILKPLLAVIKLRYRLTTLEPVQTGEYWSVRAEINPVVVKQTKAKVGKKAAEAEAEIGYEVHWPRDEFLSKANAIKRAAQGKSAEQAQTLPIDTATGKQESTKKRRVGGQAKFRDAIHACIDKIKSAAAQKQARALMNQLQADHQQELQMSGTDEPENLAMIEQRMNSQMGAKFRADLKNLAPETIIKVVKIDSKVPKGTAHRATGSAAALQALLIANIQGTGTTVATIKSWFKL